MIEIVIVMTIAYEASNQTMECQEWIAKVIETRSIERSITPRKVCLQDHQFSCWNNGIATQKRTISDSEFAKALIAWKSRKKVKESPNLYHDTSCTPIWTKSKKVKFLKQIGSIRFYREERK